jgi:LysR family transcriptional regulator, transcriptional activator of nhaA
MPIPHHFLNYHHLRYFWEVARAGNLRLAADKLHVSQPTLSGQIKSLEDLLQKQLFERTGRGLKLTDSGHLVFNHANEIFNTGARLLDALESKHEGLPLSLNLGITDSLPKLLAWSLIRPAMVNYPDMQLYCSEASAADLIGQLVSHRLDVILAEEPAPSSLRVKAYSHSLGEVPVSFCAIPRIVNKLKAEFPHSLSGVPFLLPASSTPWRHQLDRWFDQNKIYPKIVAEFDDAAMMKTAAADGFGVVPVAEPILQAATDFYKLKTLGQAKGCHYPCYIITLERSLRHPAVVTMAKEARDVMKQRHKRG